MAMSLTSALDWWARTKGDAPALIVGEEQVTYAQLGEWTSRVARYVAGAGVGPGTRVGLLGGNSVEWAVAALGLVKAGAVVVPLNPRLAGAEIAKILAESGAAAVLTAHECRVALDGAEPPPGLRVLGFDEVAALRTGERDSFRIEVGPDEPTLVLFTSGSTGLSKGVICTNRTLLSIVFEASLTEPGLRPGGRTLLVLPLAFTPGLVWGLAMSAVLGGLLVVESEFDASRAVRLIERHRIGAIFGVPLIFESMAAAPEFAETDLSSLETAITGGAAVPVPLLRAWADKGVQLRQIYGMTEVGGVATATLPDEAGSHRDSCGIGSVFTEFRVQRPDGTACDPGEPGEIVLRGPGTTPGYWNDSETTEQAIRDGWLHSGDLGEIDDGGRLKFVERLKDLIISGGINISPVEIEQAIADLDGVEEVTVISAPERRFGETPAAIVVTGGEISPEAVVEHCRHVLADYKVPRYVVVRKEPLPRLASGKIAKPQLRRQYAELPNTHPKVR